MNIARVVSLLSLLLTSVALAADAPPHPFPSDYTPHPCAASAACGKTFTHSELVGLGQRMFGLTIDLEWVMQHEAELQKEFAPRCTRIGSCYAVPGNTFQFCNDYMVTEMRTLCGRFTDKHDKEQCSYYVEMWMLGVDTHSMPVWKDAQKCTEAKFPEWRSEAAPVVWVEPSIVPADYKGTIKVYALDASTKIPVQASVAIGDQIIYTKSNPSGRVESYYPFKWPIKLLRVKRADGHDDLVPPIVTVKAARYPQVTFTMPYAVPKLTVEVSPAPEKWKNGKNDIVVKTTDAATGKPVEMRVMVGDRVAGESNKPIELSLQRGAKRPEIWVTSLFDRYSDVVVVPAK